MAGRRDRPEPRRALAAAAAAPLPRPSRETTIARAVVRDWSRSSATCPPRGCVCAHRRLAQLHPAQIADLVEAASHEEGEEIIEAVGQDKELEADVFEELDEQHQLEFLRERSDARGRGGARADGERRRGRPADGDRPGPPPAGARAAAGRQAAQDQAAARLQPLDGRRGDEPRFRLVPERRDGRGRSSRCARSEIPPSRRTRSCVVDAAGHARRAPCLLVALVTATGQTRRRARRAGRPSVGPEAELPEVARLMTDYNLMSLPVVDGERQADRRADRRRRARADAARVTGADATGSRETSWRARGADNLDLPPSGRHDSHCTRWTIRPDTKTAEQPRSSAPRPPRHGVPRDAGC